MQIFLNNQANYLFCRHHYHVRICENSIIQNLFKTDLEKSNNSKSAETITALLPLVSIRDSAEILNNGKRESRLSESKYREKTTVGWVTGTRHISVARLITRVSGQELGKF